jgi:hypothetical protein
MTSKQIEEQIATIRAATAVAMQSKETAIRFLRDAGIAKTPIRKTVSKTESATPKRK